MQTFCKFTESNMGHLLGAAGSVEALISILALKNSCIPPTINLTNQDENVILTSHHWYQSQKN